MKFNVERSSLYKAMSNMSKVVERRNTYPILANALFSVEDDKLTLRATDLDIEITMKIDAEVTEPGVTTMPALKVHEILRKMPEGKIKFETSENAANMSSGRSRFNIPSLAADSFPDLKSGALTHSFKINGASLKRLIDQTQFAISTEETRYYLNGIYLHAREGMLRAVATDGHRMALTETAAPAGSEGMPGIIVPKKTVAEINRLLEGVDDEVGISVSETKIKFEVGSVVLLSKVIEGTFPDYERVMPKQNPLKMVLNLKEFKEAVGRVSIIASEKGGYPVKLNFQDGILTLTVVNPEEGTASEEVNAEFTDSVFEVGFNAKYLMNMLDNMSTEKIAFMLKDANSPLLGFDDIETRDTLFVLMPLRV